MLTAAVDVLDPLHRHGETVVSHRLSAHEIAEPDDRAEGRAQLVAHAREEVALRLARRAQRVDGRGELLGERLLLADHLSTVGEDGGPSRQGCQQLSVVGSEQAPVLRPDEQGTRRDGRSDRDDRDVSSVDFLREPPHEVRDSQAGRGREQVQVTGIDDKVVGREGRRRSDPSRPAPGDLWWPMGRRRDDGRLFARHLLDG
jgi:hypothetical protein